MIRRKNLVCFPTTGTFKASPEAETAQITSLHDTKHGWKKKARTQLSADWKEHEKMHMLNAMSLSLWRLTTSQSFQMSCLRHKWRQYAHLLSINKPCMTDVTYPSYMSKNISDCTVLTNLDETCYQQVKDACSMWCMSHITAGKKDKELALAWILNIFAMCHSVSMAHSLPVF